jgi:hypothetical protein
LPNISDEDAWYIRIDGLINLTASNKFKVPIPVTFAVYNGWSNDIYEEAKANTGVTIESLNLSPEAINVFGPFLIRDLCAIAHESNGFSKEEDDLINSIREKIGVSSEKYSLIK